MSSCHERIHNMILDDIERIELIEQLESEDINLLKSLYNHSIVQEDPYLKTRTENLMIKHNLGKMYVNIFLEDDTELEKKFVEMSKIIYDAENKACVGVD